MTGPMFLALSILFGVCGLFFLTALLNLPPADKFGASVRHVQPRGVRLCFAFVSAISAAFLGWLSVGCFLRAINGA